MKAIDLHTHSIYSDGSLTVEELVDLAIEKGLSYIALTDHDTVGGVKRAMDYAANKDITVIPGIELSSEYQGRDIHIVGLNIDINNEEFKEYLKDFVLDREKRNEKMCKLLTDAGLTLSYEELRGEFPDSVITRAHFSRLMLKKGYTQSLKEAFDRYIGDSGPYFVPRHKISASMAVDLIKKAKGIPVLAHPMLYHMSMARISDLVDELKGYGLMAIEAIYTTNTNSDERDIRVLAARKGLEISGGSDFHGKAKPKTELGTGYGSLFIPESVWFDLRNRWEKEYSLK